MASAPDPGGKDVYLKIDVIDGESTDKAHPGWIELSSFSTGVSNGAGMGSGGGTGGGRARFNDISVSMEVSKATPKIMLAAANATSFDLVQIQFCKAMGSKTKYLEYKMNNAIIRSDTVSGTGGGAKPTQSLSFAFGKIEVIYTETDHKGKATSGDIVTWWETTKNVGG